jgi:hypothetical protein
MLEICSAPDWLEVKKGGGDTGIGAVARQLLLTW